MKKRLQGRVALVTGGAEGIGRSYAQRLAHEGASVAIADLRDSSETAELVRAAGARAFSYACDITRPEDVEGLVAAVAEHLSPVDILVNNAGIYPRQEFLELDLETYRRVMAVNIDAVVLLSQAVVPSMIKRRWGRIVNVTTAALWAPGRHRATAYLTSKAAVVGLTRGLSGDLGPHGITVNAISPGAVLTDTAHRALEASPDGKARFESFTALQAIPVPQVPDDLCGTLAFLASDDAAFVTGQTISVDGGHVRL